MESVPQMAEVLTRILNEEADQLARSSGFIQRQRNFSGADLAQAMITNPRLLVQVENGYYDMATPFFATEHTMEHLGLPEALQKNIKEDYYTAGHMMYLHDADRVSLHNQIASFIDRATQP